MQLSSISSLIRFWRNSPRQECRVPSSDIGARLWPSVILAGAVPSLVELLPGSLREAPSFQLAISAWAATRNMRDQNDEHGTRKIECYPIVGQSSILDDVLWHPFSARLQRSAERLSSVPKDFAMALSHATFDMCDNVVQHSGETVQCPARGVIAYYSTPKTFGWVVADRGRGALASLRSNPQWAALGSDDDALSAIVNKRATRRLGMDFGDGFHDLFRVFIDRDASVELWTGTAIIELSLHGGTRNERVFTGEHHQGLILRMELKK